MYPVLKEGVVSEPSSTKVPIPPTIIFDYIEMLLGGRDLKLASDCAMPS